MDKRLYQNIVKNIGGKPSTEYQIIHVGKYGCYLACSITSGFQYVDERFGIDAKFDFNSILGIKVGRDNIRFNLLAEVNDEEVEHIVRFQHSLIASSKRDDD